MNEAAAKMNTITEAAQSKPRHWRLFELIRQNTIAAQSASAPATPARPLDQPPAQQAPKTACTDSRSLLPQELEAMGITACFGR